MEENMSVEKGVDGGKRGTHQNHSLSSIPTRTPAQAAFDPSSANFTVPQNFALSLENSI